MYNMKSRKTIFMLIGQYKNNVSVAKCWHFKYKHGPFLISKFLIKIVRTKSNYSYI